MSDKKIDPIQLKVGTAVETEHTDDKKEAKKIATDHLKEKGKKYEKYYTNLNKAGLVNEPEAKKLVKKYLVNERQLLIIRENVMKEEPAQFNAGDIISVLSPVEGYGRLGVMGVVKHVDAVGTVRAEFHINGQPVIIPLNPEVDRLSKFDGKQYE